MCWLVTSQCITVPGQTIPALQKLVQPAANIQVVLYFSAQNSTSIASFNWTMSFQDAHVCGNGLCESP